MTKQAQKAMRPRQQARLFGEKTYCTGKPCKHGHTCPRYVTDMQCVECIGIKSKNNWKKRKKTHREIDRDRARVYREQNREKLTEYNRRADRKPQRRAANKRWRESHREYDQARHKAYLAVHGDAARARQNERNAANREAYRAKDKANRHRNRDRYNAVKRAWSKRNLDKVALKERRRRARHARAAGNHTLEDLVRIRRLQNDRCAYCRIDLAGVGCVDHIIALDNGGSNWPNNLQWVCRPCNSSKRIEDPIDFARRIGRLL